MLLTLVVNVEKTKSKTDKKKKKKQIIKNKFAHFSFAHKKIYNIVCNHPVATGR